MININNLPDFLIKGLEIIFECDEENKKFISLHEKVGEKLIDKASEYFSIERGYQSFFNELKSRFLFSIKKEGYRNSESLCFDYLMDFLGLRDDLNLIENFEEKIRENLEDLDFFTFRLNEYTLVFYFGVYKVESCFFSVKMKEIKRIKILNRIKYKSTIECKKIDEFNGLFDEKNSHSDYCEKMSLCFEELLDQL